MPVTVICSLSTWLESPFATIAAVAVTWLVVSCTILQPLLPTAWGASVVPLTARVTVSVQGPLPLTPVTVICSFSIWIVSPLWTAEEAPVLVTTIVRSGVE